jgi:predicted GIY-YIG superfamily endonuclease
VKVSSFTVYILCCADESSYTGHTDDLEKRLQVHASAPVGAYTSTRLSARLVWSQNFSTRAEALEAERQIKGWSRAKKEALIRSDWAEISRLARLHPPENAPVDSDVIRRSRPSTAYRRSGRTDSEAWADPAQNVYGWTTIR